MTSFWLLILLRSKRKGIPVYEAREVGAKETRSGDTTRSHLMRNSTISTPSGGTADLAVARRNKPSGFESRSFRFGSCFTASSCVQDAFGKR